LAIDVLRAVTDTIELALTRMPDLAALPVTLSAATI
jgi:hypothetical protein